MENWRSGGIRTCQKIVGILQIPAGESAISNRDNNNQMPTKFVYFKFKGQFWYASSVVGHLLADLAFFEGHSSVCDLQPNADSGEAENQAGEPAAQSDPDYGQDRETLAFHLGQRVAVEVLVALERGWVDPAPERGWNRAREAVVWDVKLREPDQEAQLRRYLSIRQHTET